MNAVQTTIAFDVSDGRVIKTRNDLCFADESGLGRMKESNVVGIYPAFRYQEMTGYGCAMTETACYLLAKMTPEKRREALSCWFGADGVNARYVRIPIDSCDYSLEEYQAVADPIADPMLETFSIARDRKYILPVMKEVKELAGENLSVLLSPWSPPAAWKTPPELSENDKAVYGNMTADVDFSKPGRCFGGRLKPEYYGSWARYLVKFILAYLEEGIPVTMLSVQNEAAAATSWDSCVWSGEQEKTFLRDFLYPELKKAGLTERVGLFIWDHNKERMIEHVEEMLDEDTMGMIRGFAYHWYSGDHFTALSMLHDKYPDKTLLHTESCGLHVPGKTAAYELPREILEERKGELPPDLSASASKTPLEVDFADAVAYAHDMIGDLNHGMNGWIDWNMIVDQNGGPRHVPGGFAAPLVATEDGCFVRTVSYHYICQIAETIRPGAVRIGCSVFGKAVEVVAAENPDKSIGIVLLHDGAEEITATIRMEGYLCDVTLPAKTLCTVIIGR
ncbi:MAG: glycoside hydrolase [Roseburia sp.]|nr:glycoside hydrolase [Roseburia sp.]